MKKNWIKFLMLLAMPVVSVAQYTGGTGRGDASVLVTNTQLGIVLNAAIIGTNVSCNGLSDGSATATASGGTNPYTYKWSNGATSQNISSLTAGTYIVTVTDTNNDKVNTSTTITEPSALTNSFTQTNISCFSGSNGAIDNTPLGGTTGYTFKWSNGAITEDISGLTDGTYGITTTDANGCKDIDVVTITQPVAALTNSFTQTNISCFSGSNGAIDNTPLGGTTGYTFKWSNGAITEDISSLTDGTYGITTTDANGCKDIDVITITQPVAALTNSFTQTNILCFGNSTGAIDLIVSGGTATYTYKWTNGAISEDISGLKAGTYTVTTTDVNGCKDIDAALITEPQPLSIILSKTESACEGVASGTASVSIYGGTPGYSYLWSTGATTSSIGGLNVGNYTIQVTDSLKCKSLKFFYIYCDLVWPGDINGDLRANHYDLLSLGMIYGLAGTPRDSVDITFEGKESLDWSKFFKSGRNQKHGDCNGDGVVNKMDAYAIKKNFGKSYGKSSSVNKKYNSSNPDLYFQIESDDIAPGTSVEVSIMVGRDTVALYGIGFEIKVDVNLIDPSTMQLTWTNSWLGTEDVDMLTFDTVDVSTGDIFVACVRTDFNTNTSYGEVARMKFNIRADTTLADTAKLNISITSDEGGVETSDGDTVVFNDAQDTLVINPTSIRENVSMQQSCKIYPNPTDGTIQLSFNNKVNIETITVYNELGQVVYEGNKKNCYKNNCKIELPDLENGIYSIRIKTLENTYLNRFTYLKK